MSKKLMQCYIIALLLSTNYCNKSSKAQPQQAHRKDPLPAPTPGPNPEPLLKPLRPKPTQPTPSPLPQPITTQPISKPLLSIPKQSKPIPQPQPTITQSTSKPIQSTPQTKPTPKPLPQPITTQPITTQPITTQPITTQSISKPIQSTPQTKPKPKPQPQPITTQSISKPIQQNPNIIPNTIYSLKNFITKYFAVFSCPDKSLFSPENNSELTTHYTLSITIHQSSIENPIKIIALNQTTKDEKIKGKIKFSNSKFLEIPLNSSQFSLIFGETPKENCSEYNFRNLLNNEEIQISKFLSFNFSTLLIDLAYPNGFPESLRFYPGNSSSSFNFNPNPVIPFINISNINFTQIEEGFGSPMEGGYIFDLEHRNETHAVTPYEYDQDLLGLLFEGKLSTDSASIGFGPISTTTIVETKPTTAPTETTEESTEEIEDDGSIWGEWWFWVSIIGGLLVIAAVVLIAFGGVCKSGKGDVFVKPEEVNDNL